MDCLTLEKIVKTPTGYSVQGVHAAEEGLTGSEATVVEFLVNQYPEQAFIKAHWRTRRVYAAWYW
jgi:hypothetical protein